jgi:hypothetical protein
MPFPLTISLCLSTYTLIHNTHHFACIMCAALLPRVAGWLTDQVWQVEYHWQPQDSAWWPRDDGVLETLGEVRGRCVDGQIITLVKTIISCLMLLLVLIKITYKWKENDNIRFITSVCQIGSQLPRQIVLNWYHWEILLE